MGKQRPTAKTATRKIQPDPERDLVEACLGALGGFVPVGDWTWDRAGEGRGGGEGRLRLTLDGHAIDFVAEVKRGKLGRAHLGPLAHRARELEKEEERLLVCAERIPDVLGDLLREQRVAYLDRGGNAHVLGGGVLVLVRGRPPVERGRDRQNLTGTEVRLLGVFLRDPEAGAATQTELARRAGIALGAVGRAREKLARTGLLEQTGKRRWRVRDRRRALQRFGEGWAAVVRHKLKPRGYRLLNAGKMTYGDAELGCLLGGELAAGILTRHLDTDHATLHVRAGTQHEVAQELGLVPDEQGPITLLERFGLEDEYVDERAPGAVLAHPLLLWAECLAVPDERVAQVADRLRDELMAGDE